VSGGPSGLNRMTIQNYKTEMTMTKFLGDFFDGILIFFCLILK